ncbi:hypothetical protein [Kitasatospora purpeofusca]|uniref:hypothetical protein n=1 Tax=Kitasatospora purpeofusca TaxID=67352 RepID=UPI0035D7454A
MARSLDHSADDESEGNGPQARSEHRKDWHFIVTSTLLVIEGVRLVLELTSVASHLVV